MNGLLRCCIFGIAALGAAGCASPGYSGYAPPDPSRAPVASGDASPEFRHDTEYTQAVERIARRRGVAVEWVNPPVKRVVASAASGLE